MRLYSNVYDYAIYLHYYEDKCFAHFKHTEKIWSLRIYPNCYKKNLMIKVLKCIFWGSNFEEHLRFGMHFLWEQFWCALTFWNAFFERAILKSTFVLKYIFFEGAISKSTYVLKCIFWGSNLYRIYGCWLVWLLLYTFVVAY